MEALTLVRHDGSLEAYRLGDPVPREVPVAPHRLRTAYAAVHVVADPLSVARDAPAIDWDATLAFRRYIWSLGLGVADAMDTAQRGGGLAPGLARELIVRSCREARAFGGAIVCGAATDGIDDAVPALADIARAYADQCDLIEDVGGRAVIMASHHLARVARDADDYVATYDRVLRDRSTPVMLHWLGPAFVPGFAAYWGSDDPRRAAETLLEIVARHADRISGIKLSLLDRELEVDLRRRLPRGVRLFTGDDLHYVELIRGDADGASDALLGVFDPLAPVATAALAALDRGDADRYEAILGPTTDLARTLFEAPTGDYKTGVVLLAYLNGHQEHFRMLGGMESARSIVHLCAVFREADRLGLFADPGRAAERMRRILRLSGVT